MPEPNLVDSIISRFKSPGFLRNNRYAVILKVNETVQRECAIGSFSELNLRLSQFCESVAVPSSNFSTTERKIVGPPRKISFVETNEGNFSAVFTFHADSREHIMFHKWKEMVVNPISRRVGYYADYAMGCKMMVLFLPNYIKDYNQVLEAADRKQLPGIVANEVYPASVTYGGGTLSQSSSSQFLTMSVNFIFRDIYTANFDELVRHGYVELDESQFTPSGLLVDPNANIPRVETPDEVSARMSARARNGFVIQPGINDMALERNRPYLDITPQPPAFGISLNQIINLAALL
jgi:hypothetical protein